jgi:hypothetical protein
MATPILKFTVNRLYISVSSRHRQIKLDVKNCPETGDALVNVITQTVAGSTEASEKEFEAFLEKLRAFPEGYLGILCEFFETFFGESIELDLYFFESQKDVEVQHRDEVPLELERKNFDAHGIVKPLRTDHGTAMVTNKPDNPRSLQVNLETTYFK